MLLILHFFIKQYIVDISGYIQMLLCDEIVRFQSIFSDRSLEICQTIFLWGSFGFMQNILNSLKKKSPQRLKLKDTSVVPLTKQLKLYTVIILWKTEKTSLSVILFYKENITQICLKMRLWVNLKCTGSMNA